MIIEELEITRWGKHDSITFDCGGSIVGVIGSNGSGKSTILSLLEFLTTGMTEDNLDTYVKNFEGNGSGKMRFRKNGKVGTIFRQVGATSKRVLEWDGKVIKKAAEVDATMAEIFGADKKAVANSVFVRQGTLEQVLFRDDRLKGFIKLLNLSFCEQRASMIEAKIKLLGEGLVDLTPVRVERFRAKTEAQQALEAKQAEIAQYPDLSVELKFIRDRASITSENAVLTKQVGDLGLSINGYSNNIHQMLAGLPSAVVGTIESFNGFFSSVQQSYTEAAEYAKNFEDTYTELTHYVRLDAESTQLRQDLSAVTQEIKATNPLEESIEALNAAVQLNAKSIKNIGDWQERESQIQQQEVKVNELQTVVDNWPEISVPESEINRLVAELQANLSRSAINQKWLDLQLKIAKCIKVSDQTVLDAPAECSECGLTLLNLHQLKDDNLEEQSRFQAELKIAIAALQTELQTKRTTRISEVQKLDQQKGQLTQAQKELSRRKIGHDPLRYPQDVGIGVENLENEKSVLEARILRLTELNTQRAGLIGSITRNMSAASSYPKAKAVWVNRAEYTTENLQQVRDVAAQWKAEQTKYERKKSELDTESARLETVEKQLNVANARIEELRVLAEVEMPESLKVRLDQAESVQVEAELMSSENYRSGLQATVTTLIQTYQTVNQSYQEIEQQVAANKVRLKFIDDLRRLRDMLRDEGIPLAFLKYKFLALAKYTQDSLQKMNANFFVSISQDKPLEFSFHRLDEATKVEYPMNKLSGGQRVRLCLSFLIALQKTLIKEVGLLVLDEPTVHVDEAGIAQMVELLIGMRNELKNSDHQIWVVDHNPAVKAALDRTLVLN